MKVEVSNGELLDKLTILELKMKNITDTNKLTNIYTEFNELNPLAKQLFENNESQLSTFLQNLVLLKKNLIKNINYGN